MITGSEWEEKDAEVDRGRFRHALRVCLSGGCVGKGEMPVDEMFSTAAAALFEGDKLLIESVDWRAVMPLTGETEETGTKSRPSQTHSML